MPLITKQNITYLALSLCFIPIAYIIKKIDLGFYANIAVIMVLCMGLYGTVLLLKKDEALYIIINKFKNKFNKKDNKYYGK